jgi:hypothetical protein
MNGDDEWQQKVNANAADARRAGVEPGCELTLVFCWVFRSLPKIRFRSREYLIFES